MSIAGGPAHRLALTSRARWHRPALALALFLLIALALPAVASSQIEETGTEGASVPTSIPGPEAFAALDTGQAPEPESTEADRDESAMAHTDLSSGQALALLGQEFEEALVAQPIPELDLSGGRSVERYLGPNSALIDVPESAADLMVEGTSPLRAPENGAPAPLDGDLVIEGDHFEPSNAPVEAELPAELADGVAFDEAGVEVVPVTSEPIGAVPVDDKLFYPNFSDAAADTDVLITPTSNGADVSFQLRSVESPERLALEFSMPEGATLETSADGGAAVSAADGTDLLTISPAFAWDAEGTPVSVSYEVVDDQLQLSVAHQGRDLLYPLIVDPLVEHDLLDRASGRDPLWNWYSSQPGFTWSHELDGLQSAARAWYEYPNAYDNAQWVLSALRDSTIEQITYQSFFRYNGSNHGSPPACMTIGLWSRVTNWWEPGTVVDAWGNQVGAGGGAAQEICGSADYDWRDVWVGPNRAVGDTPASNRNMAVFSLFTPPCCTGWRWDTAYHRLNEVWVYRHDYEAPSASFQSKPPSSWRDDANAIQKLTAFGVDEGLGIQRFDLLGPGINPLTGGNVVTAAHGCTGQRGSRCPGYEGWAREITFKLRQGRSDLTLESYDVIGRRGRQGPLMQRIDRSPPVVQAPEGTLHSERDDIVAELGYELELRATDGSLARQEDMRSGVEKIEVLVDGVPRYTVTKDCTHPDGSCAINPLNNSAATWSVPERFFEPGTYTIEIVATDALGHRSPPGSQVFEINVREDETDPEVLVTAGSPAADGSYDLTVNATDGEPIGGAAGAVGSGVEALEVYLNGQLLDDPTQDCPDGGCSMNRTYRLSGSQSLDQAEVIAFADDGAENGQVAPAGRRMSGFDYFGYGADPHVWRDHLGEAFNGRARIVRVPIDWCVVVRDEGNPNNFPQDPAHWTWGGQDAALNAIASHNDTHGPNGDMNVIAVAAGAPPWAANTDPNLGCAGSIPPSTDAADEAAWAMFNDQVADRYGAERFGLRAIEIWNEPNTSKFWQAPRDPSRFARLVNKANLAIEAYDGPPRPNFGSILVLPGGLSPEDDDAHLYLDDVLDPAAGPGADDHVTFGAVGQPNALDALSVHLYSSFTTSTKQARNRIRADYLRLSDVMASRGFANTPRWITEIGFPTVPGGPRDIPRKAAGLGRQCRRLRDNFVRFAMRERVDTFITHPLLDPPEESDDPNEFGVLHRDLSKKPAYGVLRRLATKGGQHEDLDCGG